MSGPRLFWISKEDRLDPRGVLLPGGSLTRHLSKSLRASVGDVYSFVLPDSPGRVYRGTVTTLSPLTLSLLPAPDGRVGEKGAFDLGVALLKGDAWEDLIDASVCLGARSLIPLLAERSQVRWTEDQFGRKRPRFETKVREASQLAGRIDRLSIPAPVSLETLLETTRGTVILFDEDPEVPGVSEVLKTRSLESGILALTGPEGGWSPRERALLEKAEDSGRAARASLGNLILPARLAPTVVATLVSHALKEKSNQGFLS